VSADISNNPSYSVLSISKMNYLKTILTVTIIVLGLWDGVSAVESNKRSNRIRRFANEGCDEVR